MKKKFGYLLAVALLGAVSISTATTTYAYAGGGWKRNNVGWWWEDANQSYPRSQWRLIDHKWYYFHSSGYMAHDQWIGGKYYVGEDGDMYVNRVTPDGYMVDGSGKWIPNYYDKNLNKVFSTVELDASRALMRDKGEYYECIVDVDGADDESDMGNDYKSIVRLSKSAKVDWDAMNGKGPKTISLSEYMKGRDFFRISNPKLDKRGYIIRFGDYFAS